MWEDEHASLSKDDDWPNIEVPLSIKLNIHSNKDVFLGVPLENFI